MDVKEKIGGIAEIVKRHDEVTFPLITETLVRMESKQNKDILQFNEEREKLHDRIKPLEVDFRLRVEQKDEFRKEIRKIRWGILSALTLIVVIGLFDHIINLFKNLLK